jgi:hypothetical protein
MAANCVKYLLAAALLRSFLMWCKIVVKICFFHFTNSFSCDSSKDIPHYDKSNITTYHTVHRFVEGHEHASS